jgi:hypothetical protein
MILARCGGKRVLHLGCTDAGLVDERYKTGELLHARLQAITTALWGVDIDSAGIHYLQEQGYENLLVADACQLNRIEALRGQQFDVIVASEIIEHLENPGLFLDAVSAFIGDAGTELLVTVPNAFRVDTLNWMLKGVEYVHPDHNYWFSYYTATNLLRKKGFEIREVAVYSLQYFEVVPRRFKRRPKPTGSGTTETVGADLPPTRPPLARRLVNYAQVLPRRLLMNFLFRRTSFWGDGLFIIAKVAKP